jgi:hypothetical protein
MNTQELEAQLDQTIVACQEVIHAMKAGKTSSDPGVVKAMADIVSALEKRKPTDLSGVVAALKELRDVPPVVRLPLTITPSPVQFLPAPDAVYEVEVHPIVNGKQRMTIVKTSK